MKYLYGVHMYKLTGFVSVPVINSLLCAFQHIPKCTVPISVYLALLTLYMMYNMPHIPLNMYIAKSSCTQKYCSQRDYLNSPESYEY